MTREQLIAMRDAAKERAEEFSSKSTTAHRQRQYDLAGQLGVSFAVAATLSECFSAALEVTE